VVESGGLEIRYTRKCIQGSNPCLSAKRKRTQLGSFSFTVRESPKRNLGLWNLAELLLWGGMSQESDPDEVSQAELPTT
jgi:hypothetical protein